MHRQQAPSDDYHGNGMKAAQVLVLVAIPHMYRPHITSPLTRTEQLIFSFIKTQNITKNYRKYSCSQRFLCVRFLLQCRNFTQIERLCDYEGKNNTNQNILANLCLCPENIIVTFLWNHTMDFPYISRRIHVNEHPTNLFLYNILIFLTFFENTESNS